MKLMTDEEIKQANYRSRNRAKLLVRTVKLDYETPKVMAFTVGERWKYSVIYNKLKEIFTCTCKWYTLKATPCAHIIAVNLWLKEKEYKKQKV